MKQLSFSLKKGVKFDLERILDRLKTDYPIPANPDPEIDLYFTGNMQGSDSVDEDLTNGCMQLSLIFSKMPDGWQAEEDGSHAAASDAQALQAYFDSLDENSEEATKYLNMEQKNGLADRAKADAAVKSWDQLTAAQRKIVMGMYLEIADWDQLAADFPES